MIVSKVMIFGRPGSGKSTFATQLAKKYHLPVHHLDRHFFVANWKDRDYKEFLDIQQQLVMTPKWVIDGNAMRSLETRFQQADVAIYFHFNVWRCLWRMLKRVSQKDWDIPDLADGCSKTIRWKLISYMFNFHKRYYPFIQELRIKYPYVQFHIFKTDKDVHNFLNSTQKK
ncbi:MAG: DNA topology modulation protein [Verrucomicrobia bacterium]|nr:DNA topology modulation protein [Verrucomicrobiota bacterium]MBS0646917.1 DNA topology modulation protein [Verrucomicrobiota bacterium]